MLQERFRTVLGASFVLLRDSFEGFSHPVTGSALQEHGVKGEAEADPAGSWHPWKRLWPLLPGPVPPWEAKVECQGESEAGCRVPADESSWAALGQCHWVKAVFPQTLLIWLTLFKKVLLIFSALPPHFNFPYSRGSDSRGSDSMNFYFWPKGSFFTSHTYIPSSSSWLLKSSFLKIALFCHVDFIKTVSIIFIYIQSLKFKHIHIHITVHGPFTIYKYDLHEYHFQFTSMYYLFCYYVLS